MKLLAIECGRRGLRRAGCRRSGSPGRVGWALVLAAALSAMPAEAARLTQVRVGEHAKYTRIVLELDAPTGYGVERNEAAGVAELRVELEADAVGRVVTSRSRLVESVSVQPGPGGALARVQLRRSDVTVREMVLKNPYRIVLDVAPAPATAVARAPQPEPLPPPVAAERAREVATQQELTARSEPAARPPETPTPKTIAEPGLPEDPTAEPGLPEDPTAEQINQELAALSGSSLGGPDAPAGEVAARGADAEADAAGVSSPERRQVERALAERMADAPEAGPSPSDDAAAVSEPDAAVASPGGDSGLGLTWALIGVGILLLALLLVRRRSERIAREAAATPWPPPGAEERPEYRALTGAEAPHVPGAPETSVLAEAEAEALANEPIPADAEPTRGDAEPTRGDAEPTRGGEEPTRRGDGDPAPGLPPSPFTAPAPAPEPEVVAKEEDARVIEELERRIERLEARLSDGLDARERLERQLAAHTEELRVQRAAIARTQRALRAVVRGPEAAGEETAAPGASSPAPPGGQG